MSNFETRRRVLVAAILAGCARYASAQPITFGGKPVRVFIGAAAGGSGDLITRIFADKLAHAFGVPVIVETRPGANQAIALQTVAKSPPDGQTLVVASTAYTLNLVRPEAPYGADDLVPVSYLATSPTVFGVATGLRVDTLEQFIALVRANPGKHSFGSTGIGSAPHFNCELLNQQARIKLLHVPYKGDAALLQDLAGGQISCGMGGLGTFSQLEKAGRLKILAVANDKRLARAPTVPTFSELGYDLLVGYWGLWAPRGTPKATVQKLSAEAAAIARMPDVVARVDDLGFSVVGGGADEFAVYLEKEFKRWKSAADTTGIKFQ